MVFWYIACALWTLCTNPSQQIKVLIGCTAQLTLIIYCVVWFIFWTGPRTCLLCLVNLVLVVRYRLSVKHKSRGFKRSVIFGRLLLAFVYDCIKLVSGCAIRTLLHVQIEILVGFWAYYAFFTVIKRCRERANFRSTFSCLFVFLKQFGGIFSVIWRDTVFEVRNVGFGTAGFRSSVKEVTCGALTRGHIKILRTGLANTLDRERLFFGTWTVQIWGLLEFGFLSFNEPINISWSRTKHRVTYGCVCEECHVIVTYFLVLVELFAGNTFQSSYVKVSIIGIALYTACFFAVLIVGTFDNHIQGSVWRSEFLGVSINRIRRDSQQVVSFAWNENVCFWLAAVLVHVVENCSCWTFCAFKAWGVEYLVGLTVYAGCSVKEGLCGRTFFSHVRLIGCLISHQVINPQPIGQWVGLVLDTVTFHHHVIVSGIRRTVDARLWCGIKKLLIRAFNAFFSVKIRYSFRAFWSCNFALLIIVFGKVLYNQVPRFWEGLYTLWWFA